MPRIAPISIERLPSELAAAIARGQASGMLSSSVPVQVWAHRPAAALAWLALLETLHGSGVLDERLRELVRLKIASITNCQACQLARKADQVSEEDIACLARDDARFTLAEQAA